MIEDPESVFLICRRADSIMVVRTADGIIPVFSGGK